MKKSRIMIIMLSLLLLFSCSTGKPATADLTIKTDSKTSVAYEIMASHGVQKRGTVTASSPKLEKDIPVGDVSITYHPSITEPKRIAVATVGDDKDVTLSTAEAVPMDVFVSEPAVSNSRDISAAGEYSFMIFNEDGTGWKTYFKIDATTNLPSFGTVSIGWKFDGSFRVVSEEGALPVRFNLSNDVLVQGNMKWEKAPEGEDNKAKTLDGVWNLIAVEPLAPGLSSPARLQLVVKNDDFRILGELDAAGIPAEDGVSSAVKADLEVDMTQLASYLQGGLESIKKDVHYSSKGGIAVIDIQLTGSLKGFKIPLIRGNATNVIKPWVGTGNVKNAELTLQQLLDKIGSTKVPVEGKEPVTVNQLLSIYDMVISSKGKPVDISGTWKVGDVTWTTDYGVSVSSDGRMVFIVPERSGFTVYELVKGEGNVTLLKNMGYYNVTLSADGKTLTYSSKDIKTATFVKPSEKSLTQLADEAIGYVFKDKTSENFKIELSNGVLKVTMPSFKAEQPEVSIILGKVTTSSSEIGFVTGTAQILKNLEALGVTLPAEIGKLPAVKIDVVFPLKDNQIVLGQVGDKVIAF